MKTIWKWWIRLNVIAGYPFLLLIDIGIYLTVGGHWETIRQYSSNKLKQIWNNA